MATLALVSASAFIRSLLPLHAVQAQCSNRNSCKPGRGALMIGGVGVSSLDAVKGSSKFARYFAVCKASEKGTVSKARKFQLEATQLLAELLKADDIKSTAEKHVDSLSEDFFIIASTYLDLAKKEGNLEVVSKLETTLRTALEVKETTLRPEIRLLNQLLRETAEKDRASTIQTNVQYLSSDSYFFQLLSRMIKDVESQKTNPNQLRLLTQLRMISKETREVAKAMRRK
ncbi:hypothetical protein R1sor_007961 [Riccia sorocarpa]|uniref:Uncharacterized protein n=1 Tax=Riccia sorocarpa TaxID=122646 RepID=A0ABD3HW31_9MARC